MSRPPLPDGSSESVRPRSVREVYDSHASFVWMTLQRMGAAPADLDDLSQEVFTIVHRRLDSYDAEAKLSAWLFGICLRVMAAYRRKGHRRRERLESVTEAAGAASGTPEDDLARQQLRTRLVDLLGALDPVRRAVVVMFEVEEFSCVEIAEMTGVPVGTVYSRLHAARRQLLNMVQSGAADDIQNHLDAEGGK